MSSFNEVSRQGKAISVREKAVKSYATPSKLPDADFVINPYIGCPHKCIYCYAEFMKRFTGHELDWGDFVDVKVCNKPVVVKDGTTILFGSVTDAYNFYERKYEITRKILIELRGTNAKIEILTKSDLVLRDLDVLKQIKNIRVGISMNALDDEFRKQIEPYAPSISRRIEALKTLKIAGIDTYLFMSPIFPGITNFEEIITVVRPYVNNIYFENLNLRGAYRSRVLRYISESHPHLNELYKEIYAKKKNDYWEEMLLRINQFCQSNGILYKTYFYHEVQ